MNSHRHVQVSSNSRRSRPFIYYDILWATRDLTIRKGEARITPVQSMVNIPTKRFRRFLQDMQKADLIETDPLEITKLGTQYMDEFDHFLKFLEKFGLAPTSSVGSSSQRAPTKPTWADIIAEYEGKMKAAL